MSDIAFNPAGSVLATASKDKTARLWDASLGCEIRSFTGHVDWVRQVAFSPDGKWIATSDDKKTSVAFSPVGRLLVTASMDRTAKLWEIPSGRELLTLYHSNAISRIVFSRQGDRLATASWDRTAKVWDVASGKELLTLTHSCEVNSVAFSPDGKHLATASDDSILRIYALDEKDLLAMAWSRITRPLTREECQRYLHGKECPPVPPGDEHGIEHLMEPCKQGWLIPTLDSDDGL